MPRSRIFVIYLLIVVFALGAGMLIAQYFGSTTPLLSGYVVPASADSATASIAEPTSIPIAASATESEATALPESATATSQPSQPTSPPTEAPVAAAPPASATPGANYIEYAVQKGDTLKSIAEKYSLTVRDLLAINQFQNPDSLNIGTIVRIPKAQ